MKKKKFLVVSAAFATLLALPLGGKAQSSAFLNVQAAGGTVHSELTLSVRGLESSSGNVLVGLYDSESSFEQEQAIQGKTVAASQGTVEVVFEDLPVGRYAIKVFHDQNADGALDTNALGIPSEPYGFSRNASDPFSQPEWSEAKFSLPRGKMTQAIDLD